MYKRLPNFHNYCSLFKQRLSDTSHEMRSKLCHETIKNRSESVPAPKNPPPPCPYTGAVSKMMADLSVTASQDSGINLSFSDSEGHHRPNEK